MFDNEFLFHSLSLLATYHALNILEKSHDGKANSKSWFLSILGWLGAYQYWHYYAPGLPQMTLGGYIFLGISPFLALAFGKLMYTIFQIVLFLVTFLLITIVSIILFPSLDVIDLLRGSMLLTVLIRLPYARFFSWRKKRR